MDHPITIHDLPIELLFSIFRLSFAVTNLQLDRCRLSLVCRYWRDVVQESPCLWTEISGHDTVPYIRRSLAKSGDLPINIYYISSPTNRNKTHLSSYLNEVLPQLSRYRSVSLLSDLARLGWVVKSMFVGLGSKPVPYLEALTLRGSASRRKDYGAGSNLLQLPGMTTFPKLHRLEIDGLPCELSPPGLPLNRFLSLSLVDVLGVTMEQLLDVLQNSPSLERLELGRSPVACPSQVTLTPIHLPRLMSLHLIFMPVSVSNLLLATIHAPNCSELFISCHFPNFPDDVVSDCLFTSNTKHFSPIMQTLLTRGRHKDIETLRSDAQMMEFLLNFHDEDCDDPLDHGIIRLQFKLHSVQQMEQTVRWLLHHLGSDTPKISIRLFMDRFEEVHLMDLFDSHTTVTHFALRARSDSDAIRPNPILVHMARPTLSHWPLSEMEDFIYGVAEEDEVQDEAALKMLQDRYVSSDLNPSECSEEPSSEMLRPKPLRRVRIAADEEGANHMLGEVRKILPEAEVPLFADDSSLWYSTT